MILQPTTNLYIKSFNDYQHEPSLGSAHSQSVSWPQGVLATTATGHSRCYLPDPSIGQWTLSPVSDAYVYMYFSLITTVRTTGMRGTSSTCREK
ncbi:hypothetical protein ElyMa_000885600 [Elysia marginata]|uniref:Uncharacterized protein n=1 Tax=Elysia marginata TaxID=1093978 RepID=A0AAV4H4Q5_9GAST|nr:hypothetical protein ElyMa_000885600 [Elysia marginata]